MAYSKRDYTTKEERTEKLFDKEQNKKASRISEYLSQPNVKAFNAILVDKSFSKIDTTQKGRPLIFASREECKNEVVEYFKLCYDYSMLPTIASLSLFLGIGRQSLYEMANNPVNQFSDILKNAIETCQAYQETPAVDGTLSAPVWIFTAKNYFGLHDTQNINVSASNQSQINTNNINAIKEQLILEEDTKLLDTK